MSRIHFSRLLDLLSGSAAVASNTKVQKSALYKDFDVAKLDTKKLRDLIDSNLPTFYIVDLDLIHREIISNLNTSLFKENEDYVNERVFSDTGLHKKLLDILKNSIGKLDKKAFLPIFKEIDTLYNKTLDNLSKRSSYVGYRNLVTVLGADIRRKLKGTGAFIATDAKSMVSNLGLNSYVVIGPTFEYTKIKINTLINQDVRQFFIDTYDVEMTKYNQKDNSGFSVGNLVNAGHTAAYTDKNELIGVNMPYAQQVQFLLSGTGKEHGVESAIADLYLKSNYAVKFTQNFVSGATDLLGMQFSFVISMPSDFNSNDLRVNEVSRIKQYIADTILPDIKEQALAKFKTGILHEVIPELSASPNILEYFANTIESRLKGEIPTSIQKSSIATKKGINIKVPIIKNSSILPSSAKTEPLSVSISKPAIRSLSGQFYSLASLQLLINSQLQNVISANMGGGNEKRILNYRTGRFAASAQVERLTQSREGMITAFYTYQKNPYQTFQSGYKQGSPRTRDPKLLISQSIRDIAATKVKNRMRAVLV